MRNIIIAGNWKMNKDKSETAVFCNSLRSYALSHKETRVQIVIAPPYPFLDSAQALLCDTPVCVAAQDVSLHADGAYTGEVSASMLKSMELPYCIVGHSERRQYHNETDDTVNSRILKLMEAQIVPIICIGETLEQREAEQTEEVVLAQISGCLAGLDSSSDLVIAYEPVWAIGTGKNATPEQAQQVHQLIRNWLAGRYGAAAAEAVPILYGGSMKPENIDALLSMPDIDGGLIGGASLKIDQFTAMIDSAVKAIQKRS